FFSYHEHNKDAIYGVLDALVAWEQNLPTAALKNVLLALEKDQSRQHNRYIPAAYTSFRNIEDRPKGAHSFWMKKTVMIFIQSMASMPSQDYHRNNMLDCQGVFSYSLLSAMHQSIIYTACGACIF
ncbi:hypothetical protein RDABS01_034419, partial [Bienertia sinuspersici]